MSWHPPECHFHKTKSGCKAVAKCLFPHHKVDEQPYKKPTNDEGKSAVAFVISVRGAQKRRETCGKRQLSCFTGH